MIRKSHKSINPTEIFFSAALKVVNGGWKYNSVPNGDRRRVVNGTWKCNSEGGQRCFQGNGFVCMINFNVFMGMALSQVSSGGGWVLD